MPSSDEKPIEPETLPFDQWLAKASPEWQWGWPHQRLMFEKLAEVTAGRSKRLMIFMPPRHSKSETVTVRYAAWRLVSRPEMHVIVGCYNQRLANRFSRKIRRHCVNRLHFANDRRAVDEWETAAGGGLCAVGVGGGVTGFGADLIVIDDPVKSRAEAESRSYRENTWDWFNDDMYTRLEPGASIVLIQTRWHEDDLAGRLLKAAGDGGEAWDVLSLPAIAEEGATSKGDTRKPGEALWPERFSLEELERKRKQLGPYTFASLYQQQPVPRDGGLFKRAWFDRIVPAAPEGLRWFRAYDLAVSTRTTADYTASFRVAKDRSGLLYIADGFRERMEYPEQRRYIIDRFTTERNTSHGIETALHGTAFVQELRRDPRLLGVPFKAIRTEQDKLTRALVWANLAEEGRVRLVRGPWIGEFIEEACRFPEGRHDDQVDAVSMAVRMMADAEGRQAHGF